LEQELGTPEEIDKVIKTGYGYPMGTFELSDIVGLDIHYEESIFISNLRNIKRIIYIE
jgi:3-hydroxyacyl-CoA dehydrogenase